MKDRSGAVAVRKPSGLTAGEGSHDPVASVCPLRSCEYELADTGLVLERVLHRIAAGVPFQAGAVVSGHDRDRIWPVADRIGVPAVLVAVPVGSGGAGRP